MTASKKSLHMQDVQIVNGLQTTESVFKHFRSGSAISADACVLVKVLSSSDKAIRDRIIRATNNQSLVEASSLHATDKIQRDIEDILERHDWYYERRKNYYRNVGKPEARFVTPMYLAAGHIALVMKNPAFASRLKARFMRTDVAYASVFSEETPLEAWVAITEVLKRVETALSSVRPTHVWESERFLWKWRNLVGLIAVARALGSYSYSIHDFTALDVGSLTDASIVEIWRLIESARPVQPKQREHKDRKFVKKCCELAADKYGIKNVKAVGRRQPPDPEADFYKAKYPPKPPEEILQKVEALLPKQPWKPGVHIEVAKQIPCEPRLVTLSIEELIHRGLRHIQRDGIVYDSQGNVLAVDETRERDN